MSRLTSAWDRSGNQLRQENRWREIGTGSGLFLAGIVLCFINSNYMELYRFNQSNTPIFPTFSPLSGLESAIASLPFNSFSLLLVINGIATALSVSLLYNLGKEVFRLRLPAFLAAIIYLTFLPVFIYGRTASLNGFILLLGLVFFSCGLRSRRDLRWSLGMGLSAGILILLNHWVAIIFIITLFAFFCWDTPRLISSGYLWLGSILGSLFPLTYYGYAITKMETFDVSLSLSYFSPISCLKLLLFALPWLVFIKDGSKLALRQPQWSWAKFVMVWVIIMGVGAVFTGLFAPFPIWLSVYPVLALMAGMTLNYVYQWPSDRFYPSSWSWFLFSLAIIVFIAGFSLYLNLFLFFPHLTLLAANQHILLLMSALILTFSVSGVLILRQNRQFIAILAWGLYVSSLIWFNYLHNLVFSINLV